MIWPYNPPVQTFLLVSMVTVIFLSVDSEELALILPPTEDQAWYTYFTSILAHQNGWHFANNTILLLINGVIVEVLHGGVALHAIFWICGASGMLAETANATSTVRVTVTGMSPSVFGLCGAYVGHLMLNWSETKFRHLFLFGIIAYTSSNIAWYYFVADNTSLAHMTHIAGAVQGVFMGIVTCHNQTSELKERVCRLLAFVASYVCVTLTLLRVTYNVRSSSIAV